MSNVVNTQVGSFLLTPSQLLHIRCDLTGTQAVLVGEGFYQDRDMPPQEQRPVLWKLVYSAEPQQMFFRKKDSF